MGKQKPEESAVPRCGIYRTGIALGGKEEQVPEGRLVMFHNHSEQGPPLVLLPESVTANKWSFHTGGFLVEDEEFIEKMISLPAEGLYILKDHIHVTKQDIIPDRTLVQLGYNGKGEGILFPGHFEENSITFPEKGYRFNSDKIFDNLEQAGFRVPKTKRVLH